jgi:aspartate/methionine/tyrosine aminotransferase
VRESSGPQLRKYAPVKDYYATAGYLPLRETVARHMTARVKREFSANDM